MKKALLALVASSLLATIASAQTETAGKFNLTANVGYVYNFANDWGGGDVVGKANGGLGYGARLGWVNGSGLGLSADYLGFASKWKNDFEITNNYHVVTFTPSYRISFGAAKEWGLKLGLGVGFSLADVSWIGNKANATSVSGSRVAGGASYQISSANYANRLNPNNCDFGGALNVAYSDSLGGIGADSPSRVLGVNECESQNPTLPFGLSDADIAAQFTVDTGAPTGVLEAYYSTSTKAVSYGVWRRLFASAPVSNANFFNAVAANFEDRTAYVTRLQTVGFGSFTATNAGLAADAIESAHTSAVALAACINSKGAGALVVNGVCRSTQEQAADAATALAVANCTNMMTLGIAHTYAAGVCSAPSQVALDAACVTMNSAGYTHSNGNNCSPPSQAFLNTACAAGAKGAGAISVNGVCKSLTEQAELANEECEAMGNGSTYSNGVCTTPVVASKAKDDAGFVIAPEISLEYDNGLFHADINARYIYELFNVKYDGVSGAADQLQKSGPLAVFIGAGLGVNF